MLTRDEYNAHTHTHNVVAKSRIFVFVDGIACRLISIEFVQFFCNGILCGAFYAMV